MTDIVMDLIRKSAVISIIYLFRTRIRGYCTQHWLKSLMNPIQTLNGAADLILHGYFIIPFIFSLEWDMSLFMVPSIAPTIILSMFF